MSSLKAGPTTDRDRGPIQPCFLSPPPPAASATPTIPISRPPTPTTSKTAKTRGTRSTSVVPEGRPGRAPNAQPPNCERRRPPTKNQPTSRAIPPWEPKPPGFTSTLTACGQSQRWPCARCAVGGFALLRSWGSAGWDTPPPPPLPPVDEPPPPPPPTPPPEVRRWNRSLSLGVSTGGK